MVNKTTIAGSVILVFGVIISVGWLFGSLPVFHNITEKALLKNVIVDSPDAEGYKEWESEMAIKNPNYYVYYMWNMTNSEDVLNGAKPEFQEVGPFYYHYYWTNTHANFSDGGNKVAYSLLEDYIFSPEKTAPGLDPKQVLITNVNPAYIGVLQQAGGEGQTAVAGGRPLLSANVEFLTSGYLDIVSSQYTPQLLSHVKGAIVAALNTTNADDIFYGQWANATTAPGDKLPGNWTGMLLNQGGQESGSGISLESARLLFGNGSYSLVNSSIPSILLWYNVSLNGQAAVDLLSATFNISAEQVRLIADWRNKTFIPIYVQSYLLNTVLAVYPSATWQDVGWSQLFNATFTRPDFVSVYGDYYQPQNCDQKFEMTIGLSIAQGKNLLVGPLGILDVNNFQEFMNLAQNFGNVSRWGVTGAQGQGVALYFVQYGAQCAVPIILDYIQSGSGLITTKTVDYWLWNCLDPLALFLSGTVVNASCPLQINHTAQPPSQIWTGKSDPSKINKYTYWREQSEITDLWNGTVPVVGFAENGIFPIHLTGQDLQVWDENFYRTVTLRSHGKTTAHEIEVYKYILELDLFNVSDLYTNWIKGFANETTANRGVPVLLSNWDYYGVPQDNYEKYANYSTMNPSADDVTVLYVEPITGNTVKADMKLQVNFYLPDYWNSDWWAYGLFDNVPVDITYPVLKAWQQSNVGSEDKEKLQTSLKYFSTSFQNKLRFGGAGAALSIVLIGLILIIVGVRKEKRTDYVQIQGNPKSDKLFS